MGTHPKSSSSPLFKLRGKYDELKLVAEYAGIPKPQELRILHQVMPRLNNDHRRVLQVFIIVFGVPLASVLRDNLGLHHVANLVVTLVVVMLLDVMYNVYVH